MPTGGPEEPEAGSNIVSGAGSNSLTFPLPGAPRYFVQSVIATVDNSAGGATGAVLTMADTNGAVIAKKRQGETIPAGDTGTATWALRLDDEGGAGASATGGLTVVEFAMPETGIALGANYWLTDWPIPAGAWIVEVLWQQYHGFNSTINAFGLMVSDSDFPLAVGAGNGQTSAWMSATSQPNTFTTTGGGRSSSSVGTLEMGRVPATEHGWVFTPGHNERGAGKPYPTGDTLTVLMFANATFLRAPLADHRVRALVLMPSTSLAGVLQ